MHNSRDKIFLFVTLAFLSIGAFFMVNVPMPPWASIASSFSMILFCVPVFWAAVNWLGKRDAIILFVILGIIALGIETTALITGFPYGHFSYSDRLGFRLFGVVPWTVIFAWTPLILAAYAFASRVSNSIFARVVLIPLLLVAFDLVLDPGAVYFGFWKYDAGGWFYDVPFSNFLGWLISGTIGAIFLELILRWMKPLMKAPVQLIQSAYLSIFFWMMVSVFSAMVIPSVLGFTIIATLTAFYVKYHFNYEDMIILVDEENSAIGTAPKLESHHRETPLHRAFSVFLFNGKGELLLQKRALQKKTWGGVWSNSCCGHQILHKSLEITARDRIKFELGLDIDSLMLVIKDFRYRAEKEGIVENEICPVFVGVVNDIPNPNPDEVAEVKWIKWEEFLQETNNRETDLSPWAIEEAHLLEANQTFEEFVNNLRK